MTQAIVLICLWVGVATYADTLFKAAPSVISGKFALASTGYFLCSFIALWTFRLQQWGWIIILWNSLSLALSLILSITMFNEPFTIRRQVAAVCVFVAIFLAE